MCAVRPGHQKWPLSRGGGGRAPALGGSLRGRSPRVGGAPSPPVGGIGGGGKGSRVPAGRGLPWGRRSSWPPPAPPFKAAGEGEAAASRFPGGGDGTDLAGELARSPAVFAQAGGKGHRSRVCSPLMQGVIWPPLSPSAPRGGGGLRGLLRSLRRAEEQPFVPCRHLGVLPTVQYAFALEILSVRASFSVWKTCQNTFYS